jgi:hypothetical protein
VLGCSLSNRALAREPLDSLLTDGFHAALATGTHLDADRFAPETRTIPTCFLSSSVVDSERQTRDVFSSIFSSSSLHRDPKSPLALGFLGAGGGARRSRSLAEAGDLGRWEFRRRGPFLVGGSVNRAVVRRALRRGVRLPRRCSATIFGRGGGGGHVHRGVPSVDATRECAATPLASRRDPRC